MWDLSSGQTLRFALMGEWPIGKAIKHKTLLAILVRMVRKPARQPPRIAQHISSSAHVIKLTRAGC